MGSSINQFLIISIGFCPGLSQTNIFSLWDKPCIESDWCLLKFQTEMKGNGSDWLLFTSQLQTKGILSGATQDRDVFLFNFQLNMKGNLFWQPGRELNWFLFWFLFKFQSKIEGNWFGRAQDRISVISIQISIEN